MSTDRLFLYLLFLLCGLYLYIEVQYIYTLPLVQDEFQQAHASSRLLDELPYLDFIPYKTVLGYYIHAAVLYFQHSPTWPALLNIKLSLAVINAICIFSGALLLRSLYSSFAILTGILLLLITSTFLERSSVIRVDMLTSWAGWFSLIFLLRKNYSASAILAGISFLMSQKGVYYCVSGLIAFSLYQTAFHGLRKAFLRALIYGLFILAPIALYIFFWGLLSSVDIVFRSMFLKGASVAGIASYDIRHFWGQTIHRNHSFYLLSTIGIILLGIESVIRKQRESILLFTYLLILSLFCLMHKQPWPYFFVLLLPFLAVSITHLFERLSTYKKHYAVGLLAFSLAAVLPMTYMRSSKALSRNNDVQKYSIAVAEKLLSKEDVYFMGLNLLLTRNQIPVNELNWLDKRRLAFLTDLDQTLIVTWISNNKPKIIIDNYRIHRLPKEVRKYISFNYSYFCSNVMTYAPTFSSSDKLTQPILAFGGAYIVINAADNPSINGKDVRFGDHLKLNSGSLGIMGNVRLQYILPDTIPSNQAECLSGAFFLDAYSY